MHNKASYGDTKLYINMMSSANDHAKSYLREHVKGQIDVIKNRVRQRANTTPRPCTCEGLDGAVPTRGTGRVVCHVARVALSARQVRQPSAPPECESDMPQKVRSLSFILNVLILML